MSLHPAENRGYRELFLTTRKTEGHLSRLAPAFTGDPTEAVLAAAAQSLRKVLEELRPPLARAGLHTEKAAEGSGANMGAFRALVIDRFLERNQALRGAVEEIEHVTTLLAYLGNVSEARGDGELPELCRSWERRLRRQVGLVRKAAVELGADPDIAIRPVDDSKAGRAAHSTTNAVGTMGEWLDRRLARSE